MQVCSRALFSPERCFVVKCDIVLLGKFMPFCVFSLRFVLFVVVLVRVVSYLIVFLDPRLWPNSSYKIGFVCPSVHPSYFHLYGGFLGIVSLVFPKFCDGRNPFEVTRSRAGFSRKNIFSQKFLLNLLYNENLYCLLCCWTNLIFWKIFVPDIWPKMFSASQIAGFFNLPYIQNKSVK